MRFYKDTGTISKSQNRGIITCIPKGNKLRNNLENWRPITLLNSIYKFYSTIIAERIKLNLDYLIIQDQKGFVRGRFIRENIRQTYDIINEAQLDNIEGLIVLVDFEKAFDSLAWDFILTSLKNFNFSSDTIKWVKSLQNNATSYVLQDGHLSEPISLGRGCRQGDPVSPYLFVLAAEILAESIGQNSKIEGLKIHGKEHSVSVCG